MAVGVAPASILLAALLLAGCLASTAPSPAAPPASIDNTQELLPLPGERVVAAEVGYREEVDAAVVDLPFADGDDGWEPRDVLLTYHGIQPAYDEFARQIQAHVMRFPEMVFVTDSVTFGTDGLDVDGHYEVHQYEYLFDLADDRLVGVADVDEGMRFFAPPPLTGPFSSLSVVAMALHAADGDPLSEVLQYDFDGQRLYLRWEPFDEFRPLEGECDMYELEDRYDPPLDEPLIEQPKVAAKTPHTLICLDGTLFPLWAWSGTQADGSYRLLRTTPGFELPPRAGERLPVVDYERQPLQEVSAPMGVVGPVLMPPAGDGGVWAQEIAARAQALYFSPSYLQYRLASQTPYPFIVWIDTPFPYLVSVAGIPIPPSDPIFDTQTMFFIEDGTTAHFHIVHSKDGGPERPDVHVADPSGLTFPSDGAPAEDLPLIVTDGGLQGQLGPLVPEAPETIVFILFMADFDQDGSIGEDEKHVGWQVTRKCTSQEDGTSLSMDGIGGYAQMLMRHSAADCPAEWTRNPTLWQDALKAAHEQGTLPGMPSLASWRLPFLPPGGLPPGGA